MGFTVALQKRALYLIPAKLPSTLRKPLWRAEKPLVLVPGLPGFHSKPESTELFVTFDFNTVPALIL
jgi:hypothetical protein